MGEQSQCRVENIRRKKMLMPIDGIVTVNVCLVYVELNMPRIQILEKHLR